MSSIAVMRPGRQEQTLRNYDYDIPSRSNGKGNVKRYGMSSTV